MTTFELMAEETRKSSPNNWHRIMSGLDEAVPRQFRGTSEMLGAFPMVKLPYELETGMKMGFDGRRSRPIVPDSLKSLPVEQQQGATTSWMAKRIGSMVGTSPIVVDHVLGSMGTGASDVADISSAVFDNNPLISTKDALNRFFFGQVYRTMKSDSGSNNDLRDMMARDTGSYQVQARAYRKALEDGNKDEASSLFNRADPTAQSFMMLQSSYRFKPQDRDLHPLQRSQDVADVVYGMMRNLGKGIIDVQDRGHKRGMEREVIELTNEQTRQVSAQLNMILAEETRNGLAMVKNPGYEHFNVIDTSPRMAIIRQIDPDTADELKKRLDAKHVLPAQGVAAVWPEAQKRILADHDKAKLTDLVHRARRGAGASVQ